MFVGVISDTHDNVALARAAVRALVNAGAEAVIHLGDIVAPFTLRAIAAELNGKASLYAIYGNNCGEKMGLRRVAEKLGVRLEEPPLELELGGRRLLLVHGWGSPEATRRIVHALARSGEWDAVLYGHTHEVEVSYTRGVLVLNPGEASGVLTGRPTAALLDLGTLRARVVEVQP
ncbi:MAG: YfcE family phosphodiesterase [Desulfurococcales archaeon]|nr:YfcE family phosphodiesterase [Desulfurococcales archaeon]